MTIPHPMSPLGQSDHDPFDPEQILVYQTGPYTYKTTLNRGVYRICVVGSGGNGVSWVIPPYGWGSSGGSGAAVEIIFRNPRRQEIVIYAGKTVNRQGEDSYMNLGGERMITAGGGQDGNINYGGNGGVYSVSPKLEVIQNIKLSNGNKGNVSFSGQTSAASVSPYSNWGAGGEGGAIAGGIRFQYLRLRE